jgi:hypothetical protein
MTRLRARGLTHQAVDRSAEVPDGTTSYYRTRAASLRGARRFGAAFACKREPLLIEGTAEFGDLFIERLPQGAGVLQD